MLSLIFILTNPFQCYLSVSVCCLRVSLHHFYQLYLRFTGSTYNQFHNILRLFNILPNFAFTTSETMDNYYLQRWYIRVASRVAKRLKT